jgi:hypothetical protein
VHSLVLVHGTLQSRKERKIKKKKEKNRIRR